MNTHRDPFIDDSIIKQWCGEPIEYDGKPLAVYNRADFTNPATGIEVKEITMEEFEAARAALTK